MDLAPRLGTLKASVFLHKTLLHAMTRAQLMFFDQTPIGRILSRFGSDVEAADNKIPEIVSDGMACFFEVTNISSHFMSIHLPLQTLSTPTATPASCLSLPVTEITKALFWLNGRDFSCGSFAHVASYSDCWRFSHGLWMICFVITPYMYSERWTMHGCKIWISNSYLYTLYMFRFNRYGPCMDR